MSDSKDKSNWIVQLPGYPERYLKKVKVPDEWKVIGTVEKGYSTAGALLKHKKTGIFAMCNKHELRVLKQEKIKKAIKLAEKSK